MGIDNYQELYSDDVLAALKQLKPQYRSALLYQQAGYKLKEIAEIEYRNGALESRNICQKSIILGASTTSTTIDS